MDRIRCLKKELFLNKEKVMKILHILKTVPDASTTKIIEVQSAGNEAMIVDLTRGGISYDKLVADVFSHDKVFCW
jgi:hypothetical protein